MLQTAIEQSIIDERNRHLNYRDKAVQEVLQYSKLEAAKSSGKLNMKSIKQNNRKQEDVSELRADFQNRASK